MSLDRPGRVTATLCVALAFSLYGCKSANNPNTMATTSNTLGQVQGLLQSLSHLQMPGTQSPSSQQPQYASPAGAQPNSGYQQQQPYASQPQQASGQQSAAGAQAEAAFRQKLMMQSMGFGGIFGPSLNKWVNTPSTPSKANSDACGYYTENAAKQACGNNDTWAADRIQNHQADPAEKDWYDR